MPAGSSSECRRSILSCARCRKRKQKCDRKLPCSQCQIANTPCTGYSHVDGGADIPRSIIQYLESEIAVLEKREKPGCNSIGELHSMLTERDVIRQKVIGSRDIRAMVGSVVPTEPSVTDVVSRVRMGLTPSLPLATATHSQSLRTRPEADEVEITILAGLPTSVIHGLVRKYVQMILPAYPCLYEPRVWEQLTIVLERVKQACQSSPERPAVKPDYDFLVVYLILAISATLGLADNPHRERCRLLSESLFREGIHHYAGNAQLPNELSGVQTTLLILQYALVEPAWANVWILSGATMRSCLQMGLHRDMVCQNGMNFLEIDLRRRVFWTAYCIDRAICSALQRPLSIPDPAIHAELLSGVSDQNITATGADGPITKTRTLQWIEFSQLKSTMIEVHFQGKHLQGQTWDDWLQQMEQQLNNWSEKYPRIDWTRSNWPPGMSFSSAMANLHSPSPRMPLPSATSLLVAFETTSATARHYIEQIYSGLIHCPWIEAHSMFQMAITMLFCLRHGYQAICKKFNLPEIADRAKVFTMYFLSIAEQGWTEILRYAGVYERLAGPLLETVFLSRCKEKSLDTAVSFTAAHDAELMRLLYPGPAQLEKLRFGRNNMQVSTDPGDILDINSDIFAFWDTAQMSSYGYM